MTPAQLATLNAAILAETDPEFVDLRQSGATGAMAEWFNLPASPAFYVYRTDVPRVEIQNEAGTGGAGGSASEWDWTVYKQQSPSEQGAWRDMAMGDGINFAKQKVREGIAKIFAGTGAIAAMRTHILSFGHRLATRGEKLFATGPGSAATPATMVFEGLVSNDDIVQAINP